MGDKEGPVMFVFAHQDDELAYLGLMRHLVRRGRGISVVWITDGAYSVSAEVRRRESEKTMGMLGVGKDCLQFWEYPDGRSFKFALPIIDRLCEVMREIEPEEVYTVAFEGGHPDHDIAHFAAVTAARRQRPPTPVFEAPLYNRYNTRTVKFNRLIPAETETLYTPLSCQDALFKMRAILNYRSQVRFPTLVILLLAGKRMPGRGEPFRVVPTWDYGQPPHQGKLFYEAFYLANKLSVSFADFHDAVERIEA